MKLNEINSVYAEEANNGWKSKAVEWLQTHTSISYGSKVITFNEDGTIDVDSDVTMQYLSFRKLPDFIKFNKVDGRFAVRSCAFKSLEGFPKEVKEEFYVTDCRIESLEGGPKNVGSIYDCSGNRLKDLYGAPMHINGHFACERNDLTTLNGCPMFIQGNLQLSNNEIESFDNRLGQPIHVYGNVFLDDCRELKDLRGIEKVFGHAEGFSFRHSHIEHGGIGILLVPGIIDFVLEPFGALKVMQPYIGDPDDIYDCQAELIEHGYEGIAEL